jgi:hypothetical protein
VSTIPETGIDDLLSGVVRMSQAVRQPQTLETSPFGMNHDFEREKHSLNSELEKLRMAISECSREDGKASGVRRGIQVLLETKERLLRQEFERKYQELAGEVRRQRKQHTEQVDKLKQQMADCICNMSH